MDIKLIAQQIQLPLSPLHSHLSSRAMTRTFVAVDGKSPLIQCVDQQDARSMRLASGHGLMGGHWSRSGSCQMRRNFQGFLFQVVDWRKGCDGHCICRSTGFRHHSVPKLYDRRHRLQTHECPTCPRHSIRGSASRFFGARFVSESTSSRTRFLDRRHPTYILA